MEPRTESATLSNDLGLPWSTPFTTAEAEDHGVSRAVLTRLCREGMLRRPFRGVYLDARAPDTLTSRARSLALVVPATAVVTDRTAAWLHGVDLLRPGDHVIPPPLQVFQEPGHTRVRARGTAGGERTLLPEDIELIHGVRVTTPLRTALDLGRLTPRDHAIAALDGLLRLGRFDLQELIDSLPRFRGRRGVVQLRALAPLADPRAESPGESVMRLRWLDAGLPRPELQIPVADEWGIVRYRADMGLPEIRYAAEYDGAEWHSSDEQREHDLVRRRRMRGWAWTVDALVRDNVFGPRQDAAVVFRAGIERARRRSSRGRRTA